MRHKPNLIPRLEKCADCIIQQPTELFGKWRATFPTFDAVHIELGCGKGRFTCETAKNGANTLLIGVERVPDAAVVAAERAMAAELGNVRFIINDVTLLPSVFAPGEVSRIYINFCDPWPGKKRAKRRLTGDGFLALYRGFLPQGGEIHFKTDNADLFEYSLERFAACGFELGEVTRDLHAAGVRGFMTDYEEKFHVQGVKINRCIARLL
jgi:tRNA (guanine-N7-)-methyltransferase